MNYQELTRKTVSELYEFLVELKKELLGLRIQKSMQKLQNTSPIRRNRKDIARVMTYLTHLKSKKGEL